MNVAMWKALAAGRVIPFPFILLFKIVLAILDPILKLPYKV